jgi:glutathione S-transferase
MKENAMPAPKTATYGLKITRLFDASPERVFRAWTDPAALREFHAPKPGFTVPSVEVDLRVGGRFRIEMRSPDGKSHVACGTYVEVRPPERLVFTWNREPGSEACSGTGAMDETLVTIELERKGRKTELTLVHERFTDAAARDGHEGGWSGIADRLAGFVAAQGSGRDDTMTLHYHPFSSHARTARVTALLLGIDLDLRLVDLGAGESETADYLAMNPNGMVPVLVDGGFTLWESNAIAQYLASKRRTPDLFPSDPRVRADVSRWQCWALAHWDPALRTLAFERVFKKLFGMGEPDPAEIARGLEEFHCFAKVLDRSLAGREWLVGGDVTLADVAVAVGLTYAAPAEMPLEGYANIRRWLASIERLDAWRQTAPALPALAASSS